MLYLRIFAFILAFDKFGCNGYSSCTFQLMKYPFLLKNQCKYNSRNIKEEIKWRCEGKSNVFLFIKKIKIKEAVGALIEEPGTK